MKMLHLSVSVGGKIGLAEQREAENKVKRFIFM